MWAGALLGEYTAFLLSSKLVAQNTCGISGNILDVVITQDNEDLNKTIEQNIGEWRNIGNLLERHEEKYSVPPRGPEMSITQSRKWVSPLKGERKLDLKIDVTDCKGRKVFSRKNKQKIYLPQKTARGENKPTERFLQNHINIGETLILIITRPSGASATYELKRGLSPEKEEIPVKTCGRDKKINKKENIEIRGLEIKVTPKKRIINAGRETKIEILFNRVGLNDEKDPVKGKKVNIQIKGLVDGKVMPSSDLTTDNEGKAHLVYRAGENDKQVVFEASYKPENYPDTVTGKGIVKVTKERYDLTIDVKANVSWHRKDEKTLTTGNASYSINGTMKMVTDTGSMRVNPMHLTFEPQDLELQYEIREKQTELNPKNDCPDLIYEIHGGNSVSLPRPKNVNYYLNIQNFGTASKRFPSAKIPSQMSGFLMNWFDFMMDGDMAVLKGQRREGSYCGEKQCPCKDYKEYVVKRGIGFTAICAYIDENGSMTGNLSWEEDGILGGVGLKVNLMNPRREKGPKEEGKTRYHLEWNFQRVERQNTD